MSAPIAITSLGLITPMGGTVQENWQAVLDGKTTRDHSRITLNDAPAASRVALLARHAAVEAIRGARWREDLLQSPSTALIVGTSKGPVEAWLNGDLQPAGLSSLASDVATALGVCSGPRLTLSAACCSGLHALIRAALMLQSGEIDRAIVVGAEASVHPLFIGSFQRLGVLAPLGHGCRPFDRQRRGFLMSDAAAAVCLERCAEGGFAFVEHFAMGADATHITGSDPSGATLRRLLQRVIDASGPLDLVHGHGTATAANDTIELDAIESALSDKTARPVLYSHKASIGHTLGAAGMVSIVLNCLMHRHGVVPPNANLDDPLPTQRVELKRESVRRSIRQSIAIAAGFGGPLAVVSLASGT